MGAKSGIANLVFWCIYNTLCFEKGLISRKLLGRKKKKRFSGSKLTDLPFSSREPTFELPTTTPPQLKAHFVWVCTLWLDLQKNFFALLHRTPTQEQCKQFCSKSQVCIEQIMLLKEIVSPNHCCTVGCSSLNIQKYFVRGAEYN